MISFLVGLFFGGLGNGNNVGYVGSSNRFPPKSLASVNVLVRFKDFSLEWERMVLRLRLP